MKEKNYKLSIALLLVFLPIIVLIQFTEPAIAASAQEGLDAAAGQAGFATGPRADISIVIARTINGLLAMLGTLFTFLIIISGFKWMTSGGNVEKVTAAKTSIKNASLGLFIVGISYALTSYVIHSLMVSTGLAPSEYELQIIRNFLNP